jgi:hypothetical protein
MALLIFCITSMVCDRARYYGRSMSSKLMLGHVIITVLFKYKIKIVKYLENMYKKIEEADKNYQS